MLSPHLLSFFALCLLGSVASAQSPLVVTSGRASQRAGTKLVDVYYGISGGAAPYTVAIQGSLDAGTTWTLPVATTTGNVGPVPGTGGNLRVTWNAGTDWSGQFSDKVQFRVTVVDSGAQSAPAGFSLIPAGSFQMGDQSNPLVGYGDELPVHSVQVNAFYMGKHEVTKALWDEVKAWGMANGYTDLPTGGARAANHPVHTISWYAMAKWCNARSQKEGFTPCYTVSGAIYKTGSSLAACNWIADGYRLPSEAEWEKAARGGLTGQNFPWGNTISHSQANYHSSDFYSYDVSPTRGIHPTYNSWSSSIASTSPVGSFAANGYGLYDMAGNISERCWDGVSDYTGGAQSDPRVGVSTSGAYRSVRGGSWFNNDNCRVAVRESAIHTSSNSWMGFRLARSAVPSNLSNLSNTITVDTRGTGDLAVKGLILNAATQLPLPGVTVSLAGMTGASGTNGVFTLNNVDRAAGNALLLSKSGFMSQTKVVSPPAAEKSVDVGDIIPFH